MKTAAVLFAAFAFAAAFCTGSTFAQEKQLTPQQQKLGACAKDAHNKGLKGDDYKSYMSTCAKADSTAPAAAAATPAKPMTQQEKMKACNADPKAKELTGDARKTFMSTCLKGDAAAAPTH